MSASAYARLWMDRKDVIILLGQHPGHTIRVGGARTQVNHLAAACLPLVLIGAHSENLTILLSHQLHDRRKLRGISVQREIDASDSFLRGTADLSSTSRTAYVELRQLRQRSVALSAVNLCLPKTLSGVTCG